MRRGEKGEEGLQAKGENEKKKRHAGVSKRGEILRPKDV